MNSKEYYWAHRDNALRQSRLWKKSNPDKVKIHKQRENDQVRFRRYGIDETAYQSLLATQSGKCAICKTTKPGGKGRFNIDHNHLTGKVRGLLCLNCNHGLGKFKDCQETLRSAIEYLT